MKPAIIKNIYKELQLQTLANRIYPKKEDAPQFELVLKYSKNSFICPECFEGSHPLEICRYIHCKNFTLSNWIHYP